MRWAAIHRTGADPHADATFDLGTSSLLGLPVPLDSLHDLGESVNEVLAPIGLTVQFPRVERFEDPADLVRITPLRIVVRDTQVGKALLGPLLDISRTQREQPFDDLSNTLCELAAVPLVGDVGIPLAGRTGFLAIETGAPEPTTGQRALGNPH